MRYAAAAWALLIFAHLGCGHSARNFDSAPDAAAGTGGGDSGGAAGHGEALGGTSGSSGQSGESGSAGLGGSSAGLGGSSPDQGDAGMAGMVGAECASDSSCGASCTACSGATPRCKNLGTTSQCVACTSNADCSNGGTCDTTGKCACTARFNGTHCEFQAFRGIGVLANDDNSAVHNVSHDGTVVVGYSRQGVNTMHAVRSVNGALQYIPELASLTPEWGCEAYAVDGLGTVVGTCELGYPFQYTTANQSVAIDTAPYTGASLLVDVSQDGAVIVGHIGGDQAYIRTSPGVQRLGVLEPNGLTYAQSISSDHSLVVGWDDTGSGVTAWSWTVQNGMTALTRPPGFLSDYYAWDVSADGKVIVGDGGGCVKWSGNPFSPSVLGPGSCSATNGDGSISVGTDAGVAMIWDSKGPHKITDLLGSNPDLSGWTLLWAHGVSDDGKFVAGDGTNTKNGAHTEGWIAHLP